MMAHYTLNLYSAWKDDFFDFVLEVAGDELV